MTSLPTSSSLLKGALISVDRFSPLTSAVVFQHSPDTMTRRLEPRAVSGEGDLGEAFRITGLPKETITSNIKTTVTNQFTHGSANSTERTKL